MAEATKVESVVQLADTNTVSGPAVFYLMLTGGSDASALSLAIGATHLISIKAPAGETAQTPECIRLGGGISATVTLTGTAAKAYALMEIS